MLIVRNGKPFVVVVCKHCRKDLVVRWPERFARCQTCGTKNWHAALHFASA